MRQTSLYETHKALGGTMVPFAGWEMPVSYRGTVGEIAAVRERAGLFDVSHMGEARVTGAGAFAFLQFVTANDVSKLKPGKAQYSLLLNDAGGVIDDIIVYCIKSDDYLVVLNAGCKDKDWDWLSEQVKAFPSAVLVDDSDAVALIAVQGPQAVAIVCEVLSDSTLSEIKRFHLQMFQYHAMSLMLSRTGYTGEDGFEIFCRWEDAPALWAALQEAGAQPAGLGARDVLRLEAAYPLYGHELDAEHGPAESGVAWAVKPAKGEFVGSKAVAAAAHGDLARRLVGLKMDERAIPREEYLVLSAEGDNAAVGLVTSGTFSPTIKSGIAMARLNSASASPGTRVLVDVRGRRVGATVAPLPFYRNGV